MYVTAKPLYSVFLINNYDHKGVYMGLPPLRTLLMSRCVNWGLVYGYFKIDFFDLWYVTFFVYLSVLYYLNFCLFVFSHSKHFLTFPSRILFI